MQPTIPNDQPAPDFTLPDLEGKVHTLSDYRSRIVVVNFWSAECPWAERCDRELQTYLHRWGEKVTLLPIAANANEPHELLVRVASQRDLPLVLVDINQRVADLYGAQTTPHLFVIDREGMLRYQGAFDDVTFRQREPRQRFLKQAVEALLADRQINVTQSPPYGCALVRHPLD